jgi:hypothetical protein
MPQTPPQTDTYSTALDIFDKTHPLRVDADENLKVTGTFTFTPSGTQDVDIVTDSVGLAKDATLTNGTQVTQVANFPAVQPVSGTVAVNNFPATQPISGSVSVSNFPATQPISGTVTANQGTSPWIISGAVTEINVDKNFGTWAYYAGTSGTVTVSAGQRVTAITAHCTTAGSMTINSGATITIPANTSFADNPLGNLTAPTIVFTGTDAYFIEVVS